LQGVAYWKAPEQKPMSVNVKSLPRFLPLLLTMFPLGALRARRLVEKTEAIHRQYADQPHYYLENLGVAASARGQGVSSRLIRPILEQADAQKALTYTDTVNPDNVPLYEHFGFQCAEAAYIPGTRLTVFALRRSSQ
jgi:GNAT superfamily N-acetyltransferase